MRDLVQMVLVQMKTLEQIHVRALFAWSIQAAAVRADGRLMRMLVSVFKMLF